MLFHVERLVQIVIDHMILGRLGANVVRCRRHADQVDLMEREALRANPRVLLAFLAVVEHLTLETLVSVVSAIRYMTNSYLVLYLGCDFIVNIPGATVTLEVRLLQQLCQAIGFLLLL